MDPLRVGAVLSKGELPDFGAAGDPVAHGRNSLYMPLDSTPELRSNGFDSHPLYGPPSPQPPSSPSQIHASFGMFNEMKRAATPPRASQRPFYAHTEKAPFLPPTVWKQLDSPAAWLVYYFLLNLSLTLHNKLVLVKFPFPWSLTAMHCLLASAGSQLASRQGAFTPALLTTRESASLVVFSLLFTINIAVSNLSLNLVSVALHQVIRASTPLFTIAIGVAFMSKKYSAKTVLSLVPVIAGVGLATLGDYNATLFGFLLTVLGTFLAALKTVMTNVLQVNGRVKLHPLDLLNRMSGLAFCQCVLYSYFTGELSRVREYGATQMDRSRFFNLVANGVVAFLLNVVSFSANKKTNALTMTVAANLKQVLTILLVGAAQLNFMFGSYSVPQAVYMFNLAITPINLVGILLTLGGSAWYGSIEFKNKQAQARKPPSTPLLVFQEPKG